MTGSMALRWEGPGFDLMVGFVFVFLFVWGVAALLFRYAIVRPRR